MRPVFVAIQHGELRGTTSVMSLLEVLVKPLATGNEQLVEAFKQLLTSSPFLALAAISIAVAERAAEIRADFGFRAPDAIQLAAAVELGCRLFITNDQQLKRFSELPVAVIEDYRES